MGIPIAYRIGATVARCVSESRSPSRWSSSPLSSAGRPHRQGGRSPSRSSGIPCRRRSPTSRPPRDSSSAGSGCASTSGCAGASSSRAAGTRARRLLRAPGRAGLRALARPGADRQRGLQRVGPGVPAGDRPHDARRARSGRGRRRVGDASRDAADLPPDERRDQGGDEALAAARRRRLERVFERQAVVRRRRPAPHRDGRDGARRIPAPVRLEGGRGGREAH